MLELANTDMKSYHVFQEIGNRWGFRVSRRGITLKGMVRPGELPVIQALTILPELKGNETISAITSHLESRGYRDTIDFLTIKD